MKKEEIISNETLLNFCYENAKNEVLENWAFLSNKEKKKIDKNRSIVLEAFLSMHKNINIDKEIELIKRYYLNERIEKETNKCLNKYRSCTTVFIKRMEYFITREII